MLSQEIWFYDPTKVGMDNVQFSCGRMKQQNEMSIGIWHSQPLQNMQRSKKGLGCCLHGCIIICALLTYPIWHLRQCHIPHNQVHTCIIAWMNYNLYYFFFLFKLICKLIPYWNSIWQNPESKLKPYSYHQNCPSFSLLIKRELTLW